jgi:hypothetical protein
MVKTPPGSTLPRFPQFVNVDAGQPGGVRICQLVALLGLGSDEIIDVVANYQRVDTGEQTRILCLAQNLRKSLRAKKIIRARGSSEERGACRQASGRLWGRPFRGEAGVV